MHKPERVPVKDALPSVNSDDEDEEEDLEEEWSSGVDLSEDDDGSSIPDSDSVLSDQDDDASTSQAPRRKKKKTDTDDEEMPYETGTRKTTDTWKSDPEKKKGIERLPIKLADGHIQKSKSKVFLDVEEESVEESEEEETSVPEPRSRVEDVATGARFGRLAVVDVVSIKSRKARVEAAKEQIAGISQEIVADPENSVRVFMP